MLLQDGVISGCRVTSYLLEKSRIVSHAPEERNFHVFYEMLAGLAPEQRERYGLMSHEKYFYLNQVIFNDAKVKTTSNVFIYK